MTHAIQWLRSLLFVGQMYLAMPLMALWFTPLALIRREAEEKARQDAGAPPPTAPPPPKKEPAEDLSGLY